MPHKNIVASYLLLYKDDTVLLSKRLNTGYRDGEYSVVAGHVEPGETFTQTVIREAREEVGIELLPSDVEVIHVQHRKSNLDDSERVHVYFRANNWKGTVRNCEPNKCSDLMWSKVTNLPSNMVPCVKHVIEQVSSGNNYSEYGW